MPLDDAARRTVEALEGKIAPIRERIGPLLAEMRRWQSTINGIYEMAGEPVPYPEAGEKAAQGPPAPRYAKNEFLGVKRAVVVRRILADLGPQTPDEIYRVMFDGGFHFPQAGEAKAKEGLAIALGKILGITLMRNGAYAIQPEGMKRRAKGEAEPSEEDEDDDAEESTAPKAESK